MTRFADARALARAAAAVALSLAAMAASPASAATITISDTTFSGNQTVCPRADAAAAVPVPVNAFQVAATADVALGRVQVRLAPAGGYASIERVEIRSADLATLYGAIVPNADLFWMSLSTPLPVTTGATSYRIAIVPRRHADMPPPSAGKAVAVQAFLMGAIATTAGHVISGNDLASATVTVDNLSPANVVWSGVTSAASVQLSWAAAADVVVLKRALGPVADLPVEGATYASNTVLGSSQVAFAGSAASFNDTAVTAGRPYYYRVFTRSSPCGNFSTGSAIGPVFAGGSAEGDLTANSTKPVVGIVSPVNGPVTRPFKVQVRVFSPNTLPITEVRLYGNQSGTEQLLASTTGAPAALTRNANYDSGAADPASGFYEFTAPAGFAEGTWTLRAWAANVASPQLTDGVYSGGVGVNVSANVGDGRLLVRDNSSQMCADCHAVKTHSSETVGMGLGSWFVGCRGCHDPHGTTNAKLIAKEITPPSVNGAQAPQQIFYSGAAGNVNGGKVNPSGTGLCQACHTRTTFYSRGAINQTHGDGQPCASCHKHEQGLGAGCSSCHGDPGRNTAGGDSMQAAAPPRGAPPEYETATSTNAVGKHVAHVSGTTYRGAALACSECHVMPNAHNGTVEAPSFPNLGRADGASPSYASATCTNTYCHAGPPARNFGGTNRNPSWTAAATLDCQSCHASPPSGHQAGACTSCHGAGYELTGLTGGARATHIDGTVQATNCTGCHGTDGVNAAPPVAANAGNANAVGAHQAHVTKTNVRTSALVCSDCHADFANTHNNGSQNVVFSSLGTFGGMAAQYQGIVTPANPTCTSTYCHAGAPGGTTAAPNWTTAGTLGCNSCHGNAPGYPHPGNTTCADCHPSAGGETYSRTGATTGTVVRSTHLDTNVDRSTSGCTSCHGTLSASGVNLVVNTNRSAPGFDAAGSEDTVGGTATTSPGVGAHRTHLTSAALRSGGAAACTECHALPPTDTDTSHAAGGGTGGARATLAFPNMGGLTGTYSASTSGAGGATAGNCSNTYCHGGKFTLPAERGATPAPSWTGGQMNCGSCHQAPPATSDHSAVTSTRNCGDCHLNYNCTSGNLAACTVPAEHLNVLADPPSLSCSRCHGTTGVAVATTLGSTDNRLDAAPPRDAAWLTGTNQVGPHQAHVNPTQASQIMRPIACAECHGSAVNSYANTHSNGTTEVTFANATSANLRGHTPTQTTGNPWSCNTYCHDAATATGGSVAGWTWNTTTTATCGSCHGSPPSNAHHVSVGTNQPATACFACHNTTVTSGGTIAFTGTGAAAATQHIDGTADLGTGVSCRSCHGSATNDAPPTAANAANLNAVGAHQSHVLAGRNIANALACTICHPSVTANNHADATVNMAFTGAGTGTIWSGGAAATSNCSTSWCHGGAAAQASWGRAQGNPLWNDATDNYRACNACHGSVPPIAARHPQNTLSACSVCHGTGYATTGITGGALGTHVNGTVEPRTGCTACHGDLSLGSGQAPGVAAAPGNNGVGVDSHGNTAVTVRTVGAHDAHVRGPAGTPSFRTAALACSECHFNAVPAAGDTAHANGTIAIAGGALALDPSLPATTAAALTWNGTTCSNTYCHGNFKNGNNLPIAWAQNPTLNCNSCHGRGTGATATPPGGSHVNNSSCATCHPDYTVAANLGTHIDGNLDVNGTGCNLCHGQPPAITLNHPQNPTCTACHGAGYTPPAFGTEPTTHNNGSTTPGTDAPRAGCTACHGVLAGVTGTAVTAAGPTVAPGHNGTGVDSTGSTNTGDAGVGAHDAHVRKTNLRSAALTCDECHSGLVPATGNVSHADGVTNPAFGTLARTGSVTPAYTGGSCSATYCHGNFTNGNDDLGGGTPTTPGQVTGLTSPTQTNRSVSLSWTAVTGAVMYKVERGTSATGPWAQVGTSTGTTYVDDGLWDGTTYWYRVRAWNTAATGDGTYSAVVAQGTTGGGGTPATVTYNWQIATTGTVNGLTFNWPNATCGAQPSVATLTETRTSMTTAAQGCTSDRLVNTATNTAAFNMLTFVSPAYAAARAISAGSYVISLRNATGTANMVFGVQLGYVTGGTYTMFGTEVTGTAAGGANTVVTLNLSGQTGTVPVNASLVLRIRKITVTADDARLNLGGTNGVLTVTETPTATPPPLPAAPTGTPANPRIAAAASTSLTVAWDPVANASTYKVERSANGTSGWAQVAQPATTSVADRGLASSTTYYYRVRASNPGGDAAAYSVNASGATTAAVPAGAISWTGTFTPASTTLTCTSCHGNPPGGTHPTGANACSTCHTGYGDNTASPQAVNGSLHMNGTANFIDDCTGCHAGTQGARREVVSEFAGAWSHKKSAGGVVTKWDCVVCHMEGDPATGNRSGVHANGVINLRDPDTGNNIEAVTFTGARGNPGAVGSYSSTAGSTQTFDVFRRNLGVALENDVAADRAAVQAIMVNQCLKCHDVNGALAFNAGLPLNAMINQGGTRSPGKPFATTITGAGYNGNASESTIANGGTYNTACNTTSGTATVNGCVPNVKDSFATGNSSYHPILGRGNNWFARATRMVAPWNLAKINTTTANAAEFGYLMSCWDCHATSTDSGTITRTVTAHGGAETLRGTATVSGTPSTTNAVTLCVKCHLGYNTTGTTYSHGTNSAFETNTGRNVKGPYIQYGCNLCHSSGYRTATAATRPVRAKDSHGVNALPSYTTGAVVLSGRWASTTAANKRPFAFIRAIDTLGDHEPRVAAGTTLSAASTCDMLGTATGGPGCDQGPRTLGPGGTY